MRIESTLSPQERARKIGRLIGRVRRLEDSEAWPGLYVLLTLSLALALGSWVEVWALANANATLAGAESVAIIIICSSVIGGAIIPDR